MTVIKNSNSTYCRTVSPCQYVNGLYIHTNGFWDIDDSLDDDVGVVAALFEFGWFVLFLELFIHPVIGRNPPLEGEDGIGVLCVLLLDAVEFETERKNAPFVEFWTMSGIFEPEVDLENPVDGSDNCDGCKDSSSSFLYLLAILLRLVMAESNNA